MQNVPMIGRSNADGVDVWSAAQLAEIVMGGAAAVAVVSVNEMFGVAKSPGQLFRFLPIYTTLAGGIGFAIGWIVGRNL